MINDEKKNKLNNVKIWKIFSKKVKSHAKKLKKEILNSYKLNGKLFGYGASARSSTLLNYCKLSNKQFSFIIDQNKLKQGLYTPGTNIVIRSIKSSSRDIFNKNMLLLAWNFKDEILKKIKNIGFKGKIILPIKKR